MLFAELGSNPNNETNPNSPWVLAATRGENTQDYVYAISGEEYFKYFGAAYLAGDGWNLVNYRNGYMTATSFAAAQGAKNSSTQGMQGLADSWTRSPSSRTDFTSGGSAYGVFWSGTGSMNVGREVTNAQNGSTYGTIPMINVDLGNSGLSARFENGKIKAEFNSEADVNGVFILAAYNEYGRMVYYENKAIRAASSGKATVEFDAQAANYPDCSFKVFAWDDNYVPLSTGIQLKL